MFILQIHSIATRRPFSATSSSAAPGLKPTNLAVTELKGVVHLFRDLSPSTTSLTRPSSRSTKLFVVAVPNYLSPDDFLLFCGSHLDHFSELCFLRNDGMEDRYSVLITLANQLTADGIYCNFNGKRFRPSEAEVCHIYFVQSAESYELAEEAGLPLPGFVELPTCPVCLERLDQDTSGIQTTLCDHSFQCPCVLKWTYLSCQVCRLCQQQDEKPSCAVCGKLKNLWVCVICGFVGCGRYEERHAIRHWKDTQHCYSLGLETQQVWDYVGETYVHRLNQSKADAKSVMMNSRCMSHHEECGTCGCSEDSGIGGALFDSKFEADVPTAPVSQVQEDLHTILQEIENLQRSVASTSSLQDRLNALGDQERHEIMHFLDLLNYSFEELATTKATELTDCFSIVQHLARDIFTPDQANCLQRFMEELPNHLALTQYYQEEIQTKQIYINSIREISSSLANTTSRSQAFFDKIASLDAKEANLESQLAAVRSEKAELMQRQLQSNEEMRALLAKAENSPKKIQAAQQDLHQAQAKLRSILATWSNLVLHFPRD